MHDGIAVVAGDEDFIAAVYADLSPPTEQAVAFVNDILSMNDSRFADWAVALLANALGSEATQHILGSARATP